MAINFDTEAFVVMKPGDDFKLTPIVLDEVRDDELLIEMKYSGICHTVCNILPSILTASIAVISFCRQILQCQTYFVPRTSSSNRVFSH